MPDEPVALAHIKLAWHCAVLASICADVTPISATAMLVLRSMLGERRGRWQRASAEALVKKRCGGPRGPLQKRTAAEFRVSECSVFAECSDDDSLVLTHTGRIKGQSQRF